MISCIIRVRIGNVPQNKPKLVRARGNRFIGVKSYSDRGVHFNPNPTANLAGCKGRDVQDEEDI